MSFDKVGAGNALPEEFNVVIEIPAKSEPIKYEVDKDSGALLVDRFIATSMRYPVNYGYIPATLADDGDPADALVITPAPLISGSVIACRPIGVLKMTDESGVDAKILAVPTRKLTTLYDDHETFEDVSLYLREAIQHFFEHYKDLEKGKWVKVEGWAGPDEAKKEILDSVERYRG
jgi:inorganic pyrophosphatase